MTEERPKPAMRVADSKETTEPKKESNPSQKPLSYEELVTVANQLNSQVGEFRKLVDNLQKENMELRRRYVSVSSDATYKTLEVSLRIIESDKFDSDFIEEVKGLVKDILLGAPTAPDSNVKGE
jgi:hypothetical protein